MPQKVFLAMKRSLKSCKSSCFTFMCSRRYCEGKSIYQRGEDSVKSNNLRTVYGQPYPEWRKPWIKRDGEWTSKLSLFIEKNPSPYIMNALQSLPDLNTQKLRDWWSDMKVLQEIHNQKYLPERVAILGSNLAAIHFFTYRQASIRLKDSNDWVHGNITQLVLPDQYVDGYFVEAVDCANFHHHGLRYEGVQNLSGLNFLRWLSLKNNKYIDVWCLDRIAGQNGKSLEFLDLTGCNMCVGSIYALARMPALRAVTVTDPGDNITVQAALSMLEAERPNLLIKAV